MPEVSDFAFAEADDPLCYGDRWVRRLPHLDLSFIRQKRRIYDEQGCRNRLRDFRRHCCGEGIRLTKGRCEESFSKRRNFLRSSKATPERKINGFVGSI
jgi:hypothetical protein